MYNMIISIFPDKRTSLPYARAVYINPLVLYVQISSTATVRYPSSGSET
jgi:hypothetical protein